MGNNLTIFTNFGSKPFSSPLLGKSIISLKQNFSAYKALCENFYINQTEFQQIFGEVDGSLILWDTDKNGLIDSFQLFAGLIIFSQAKFDDKVRFLFEIFDLNEVNYLTITDVEFMIYSVLSSVFKLCNMVDHEVSTDCIEKLVNGTTGIRTNQVKITELLRFGNDKNDVQEFMRVLAVKHNEAAEKI